MRRRNLVLAVVAIMVCAGASAAHSQTVVGVATCFGPNGSVTANLTGYLLDLQRISQVASSGAGAGKLTYSEAEVEMPGSNFASLTALFTSRTVFSQCQVSTSDGTGLVLAFNQVKIAEVKLLGGTSRTGQEAKGNTAPVARVVLDYKTMAIQSSNQGGTPPVTVESQGASLNSGWNRVTNTNP